MTTFLTDTFTDTSGTALNAHTSDSGHSWSRNTAFAATAIPFVSNANTIVGPTTGASSGMYSSVTPASADYSVTGVVKMLSSNTNDVAGVTARGSTTAKSYYEARYLVGTGWQLNRVVANVRTQIGSTYTGDAPAVGTLRTVKLTVNGSTISMDVEGVQRATGTDTQFVTAGVIGLLLTSGGGGSNTTNLHLDSLTADTLPTNVNVTPGVGALTYTGFAPIVTIGIVALPGAGTLSYTGFAPTAVSSGAQFYSRTLTRTPIGGSSETAGFQVMIPGNYNPAIKYPTIMQLGGSAQRGTDNTSQMTDGLATRLLADPDAWQTTFEPTIVIFPQWPGTGVGPYGGREWAFPTIQAAFDAVAAEWSIDTRRKYVFGFSLGADVGLESLFEHADDLAGVLVAEGSITNREGILSGNDPAGTWTSAQAAAEVAALVGPLAIRHFNSTADTNALVSASRETRDAMLAAWTPNYAYSEGAPVTGLTHVAAYTAVVNDNTQWAWLLDQWQPLVPLTAALTYIGFAPTVSVSDNKNVLAGMGALLLTGFAPSIAISDHKNVLAGTGALAFDGFAPTISVSDNQRVLVGTGLLSFEGFAPTISVSDNQRVSAGTGLLTLVGFAPTVVASNHRIVLPNTGALVLTGFRPIVSVSDTIVVQPGVASLLFAGFSPSVSVSDHQVARPGTAQLIFDGFAPSILIAPIPIVDRVLVIGELRPLNVTPTLTSLLSLSLSSLPSHTIRQIAILPLITRRFPDE